MPRMATREMLILSMRCGGSEGDWRAPVSLPRLQIDTMKDPVAAGLASALNKTKSEIVVVVALSPSRRRFLVASSSVTFNAYVPYATNADATAAVQSFNSAAIASAVTNNIQARRVGVCGRAEGVGMGGEVGGEGGWRTKGGCTADLCSRIALPCPHLNPCRPLRGSRRSA